MYLYFIFLYCLRSFQMLTTYFQIKCITLLIHSIYFFNLKLISKLDKFNNKKQKHCITTYICALFQLLCSSYKNKNTKMMIFLRFEC
jgi:hypothetical protein